MPDPDDILRRVFGFDAFRPGQREIVDAILGGRDVLAIMPTGGGKSLCFQLPALAREGVTVVVSPLIALMRDQVAGLREAGVEAGALTSANDAEETARVTRGLERGTLKLLYLAPERLGSAGAMLRRIGVGLLAVDEAHCVSQWGHDFRPDYLRIGELRRALGGVQTAAFTATADEGTRAEIAAKLFDGPPAIFLGGFDRPELFLSFKPKDNPRKQLLDFVLPRRGQSGIVYASSRNKTEVLATALRSEGLLAMPYHAGLDSDTRARAQDRFQREEGMVICATIAFGMGVDKPDIRYVVQADLPKSVESYYQEIGRAGRDGAAADTLTLYGIDDIKLRRRQIDEGAAPDARKRADHDRLNALLSLAEAPRCRRQTLLAYFGETGAPRCGNCDLCRTPPPLFDGREAAQKALSAIYRTGQMFGVEHVVSVLRGEPTDRAKKFGHDALAVYGAGRDRSAAQWRSILRQLYALGLTSVDPEKGGWSLTEAARPVLRGEAELELRAETAATPSRSRGAASSGAASSGAGAGAGAATVAPEDEPLLSALKALRRRLADAQGVPAYVVFPDRTLMDIAARRPATLDALAGCHGVGAAKLARYGADFLEAITGAPSPAEHPRRVALAARGGGAVYDRLHAAQLELSRGPHGADKPLSLAPSTLAKIVAARPLSLAALEAVPGMGPQKTERFGAVFLSILADRD